MRIVSLLPSATEIVCQTGLGKYLVGVSHGCDYPLFVRNLPDVTKSLIPKNADSIQIDEAVRQQLVTAQAIYHLDMDVLKALEPDFIITQSLCEVCAVAEDEVVEAIRYLPGNVQIINLQPMSLQDVFDTFLLIGEATGFETQATEAMQQLKVRADKVIERTEKYSAVEARPGVVFLEWIDPLFNAGHWTPELIEYAGGVSLLGHKREPSTTLSWDAVVGVDPDVLFIACCGYDLKRTLVDMPILAAKEGWVELNAVRKEKVYVMDGNAYFSRPGPRLIDGLEMMAHVFCPDVHHLPDRSVPVINYGSD